MNTIKRNARVVGKNSKSYDDKHPENPIALRPIRSMRRWMHIRWVRNMLRNIKNCSRPIIAHIIHIRITGRD